MTTKLKIRTTNFAEYSAELSQSGAEGLELAAAWIEKGAWPWSTATYCAILDGPGLLQIDIGPVSEK